MKKRFTDNDPQRQTRCYIPTTARPKGIKDNAVHTLAKNHDSMPEQKQFNVTLPLLSAPKVLDIRAYKASLLGSLSTGNSPTIRLEPDNCEYKRGRLPFI